MKLEIGADDKQLFIIIDGKRESFRKGIKKILSHKGWSREVMANYLKVSPRTVEGWLTGRRPNNTILIALNLMFP